MGCTKTVDELFVLYNIYLQLMFTQSAVVSASGFPLLATYVVVIKAAWSEVTVSLMEKITLYVTWENIILCYISNMN